MPQIEIPQTIQPHLCMILSELNERTNKKNIYQKTRRKISFFVATIIFDYPDVITNI
jgi:hypothetical protein